MPPMYRPEAIVIKVVSIEVGKKEDYKVEVNFAGQKFVAKPSSGAIALFFKDQEFSFPFKKRGVIEFKLIRVTPPGIQDDVASGAFDLSVLKGNMEPSIERSIRMDWVVDSPKISMRPLLTFKLDLVPEPPSTIKDSVWGNLGSEDPWEKFTVKDPNKPLFHDVRPPVNVPPNMSLWLGIVDPQDKSPYGTPPTQVQTAQRQQGQNPQRQQGQTPQRQGQTPQRQHGQDIPRQQSPLYHGFQTDRPTYGHVKERPLAGYQQPDPYTGVPRQYDARPQPQQPYPGYQPRPQPYQYYPPPPHHYSESYHHPQQAAIQTNVPAPAPLSQSQTAQQDETLYDKGRRAADYARSLFSRSKTEVPMTRQRQGSTGDDDSHDPRVPPFSASGLRRW
eukprot:Protomagalhaensia_wolfi_Nauph_80__4496@NODE_460_length_2481_cov_69_981572_g346_i0_p1_GENE_NODE_460_length_2481_cov_69_981572_g346_i0NODE_460_length_2481_cov_69_981572_g346_i0_p1_ORF_typecomplete_len389_score44_98_NODE_460_length_2481_cov_69_981572_g346_i010302196